WFVARGLQGGFFVRVFLFGVVGYVVIFYLAPGSVTQITPPPPLATIEAFTWIPVAVGDAAVEAHMRCPITGIPAISAVIPSPISGSPEQAWFRCHDPGAWHPVILFFIGVPCPVAGCPEIAFIWANGLVVNRQGRWADTNDNRDLSGGKRRRHQKNQRHEKKTTQDYCYHRCVSLCACCAGSAMRPGFCVIFIRPMRTGRGNTAFSSHFLG